VVIGVDVGGTTIKAVLGVRGKGECGREVISVVEERRRPTPLPGDDMGARVVGAVVEVIETLRSRSPNPVIGAGLVLPGIVDEVRGRAVESANLGLWDVAVRASVQDRVGLPIAFGHDVRAGGLAEARLGAAVGLHNVVFVPIGTGISAAIQIDGRIYTGSGYAGELGHVDIGHTERCACGRIGCLEAVASGAAIRRRYEERSGSRAGGAEDVIARSAAGDRHAVLVWGEALSALASALAWVFMVLAPEAVVLGGGLSEAGGALFAPLADQTKALLRFGRQPRLLRASLGYRSGCLGAALLALDAASAGLEEESDGGGYR
jgi:glucokinase